MAFSGTSFSEIETARLEVAAIIARQQRRLIELKASFSTIVTEMTATGIEYGPLVTAMNALLATAPTDQTFIVKKGEVDKHLADFNSVKAAATALDTLVNT